MRTLENDPENLFFFYKLIFLRLFNFSCGITGHVALWSRKFKTVFFTDMTIKDTLNINYLVRLVTCVLNPRYIR